MSTLFDRYLRLLGLERETPSPDALTRLVSANIYRIPFENVSKLYRKRHQGLVGIPAFEQYLDGVEHHHFGGTCHTNNYYFYRLLDHLGYRVRLCGADMGARRNVHVVSIVEVDGREYLIDMGYAAPFDFPIPRDLPGDFAIAHRGNDQYILKPQDEAGRSEMVLIRDGEHKHGYRVNPDPRQIEDFSAAIEGSYGPEATFMKALLLARLYPNRSRVVHNMKALEMNGTVLNRHEFADRTELAGYVEQYFDIPQPVLFEVLDDLGNLRGDPWS